MQQQQACKSSCDSAPSSCKEPSCVKVIVEEEGPEEYEVDTGDGRAPGVGSGGCGGTSCVSNSPLTSSSGGSVHETQPPQAVPPVAPLPLGLVVSDLNEPLYPEQAHTHHTGSRGAEAPPVPPPLLHPIVDGATGAVDTSCNRRTARIMRLDPAATSLSSSSGPVVETRHMLRLHPSEATHQPLPEVPQLEGQCGEEGAPPSKRLRPSLEKLSSPHAPTHTTATALSGPTTIVGSGSGGRVLRLTLPIRSSAPTDTALEKAHTAVTATLAGGGIGGDTATTNTNVSADEKALTGNSADAADEARRPADSDGETMRTSNTSGHYRLGAGTPASANAVSRPPPIPAGATLPAVFVKTSNVEPAVLQQPQIRSTASIVSPSYAAGTNGFPRLRSLTPTPYAGAPGSPCRRHRFVGVNLPSAPPPSFDFSSIQRTVKEVYEVHEKLSEGTYGEVYKGVDKRTGAAVALKRLKMLATHHGFPQTSLREVIALRHIQIQRERLEEKLRKDADHRGPVAVTDPLAEVSQLCDVLIYDRQQRDIVLVFPYATASLAGLCRRQFAFTPSELAFLMKKLFVAVRKLHEMRIIHRDIKSDNVLVTSEGEVQLTDFGLCSISAFGSSQSGGHVWRTPSVITLAYRPPEMLLGSTAYDEKVDIWSVGCLLAQMYLLEPPFYKHRTQAQAQQQQQRTPERTAATELEQLSRITEVLGPLPPVRVYHPDSCQHMRILEQLEMQGRQAESGKAAQPANWGKLQTIFEPSFLFQQFHGFRGWFEAELQRSRHQLHRRPTQACMDVLCATLQLDPQQRPTAAELLRMPYFTTLDDAPLLGSYQRLLPVTPEREAEVRRGFMMKVQRTGDSHTQRGPHK